MPRRGGRSVLLHELVEEQAANLGRMGRRLEEALHRLRACEDDGARRPERVADAAEALFMYVVQREVCGFRDTAGALDAMGVPREVRLRMGPRTS
ncbi:MAG: hypothetical protein PVI57_09625 [Gemmatimonadota bacterium]